MISQVLKGLLLIGCMIAEGESVLSKKARKVKENEFPFIVSIQLPIDGSSALKRHDCGGALISDKHVLTAAHCIHSDKHMEKSIIIVGSPHLRYSSMKKYKPESWLRYEDWAENEDRKHIKIYHDIAVIKLKWEGQAVNPTIALLPRDETPVKTEVILAGWGIIYGGSKPVTMHKAPLHVSPKSDCAATVRLLQPDNSLDFNRDSILCLTADPWVLGACGDSGSPFLDENMYVVGIHSGICPKLERLNSIQVNVGISTYYHRKFIDYAVKYL